jgi:hypothetical protein
MSKPKKKQAGWRDKMGNYNFCEKCGVYDFKDNHKCDPEWIVISPDWNDPDDPEDHYKGYAYNSEGAVLFCADRYFSEWDYPEEMELWVKKAGDTEWEKYYIDVQSVPEFSATKKDI